MTDLPLINWEYCEFELPHQNADYAFLDWVREGWELIGIHKKGKGLRKPLPMALMRRALTVAACYLPTSTGHDGPALDPLDVQRPKEALVGTFGR